jgi:hypothetical protein
MMILWDACKPAAGMQPVQERHRLVGSAAALLLLLLLPVSKSERTVRQNLRSYRWITYFL